METQRLYLRQQTRGLLEEVLKQSVEDQMIFFGTEDEDQLKFEHTMLKKRLVNTSSLVLNSVKWDILDLKTGRVMGSCGFHNWEKEHERAEIGYRLHEQFRKQGYMSEAIRKILEYGFNTMQINRIEAFISPDNQPSIQLIKTLNFTYEGTLKQHYKFKGKIYDSEVYALLKSEYRQ